MQARGARQGCGAILYIYPQHGQEQPSTHPVPVAIPATASRQVLVFHAAEQIHHLGTLGVKGEE